MDEKATNKCLQCNKTLIGRLDKKFCDAYCRNAYNNKVKRGDEQMINQQNSQLRRNRRILKTLSPVGKSTVRKEVMASMGYDFATFTSMFRTSPGNVYYMCYEYGFLPIIDKNGVQKAVIINRSDQSSNWQPWKYVKAKNM